VLTPLTDVGLEYVKLASRCQRSQAGEAQRLKLAGFLAEAASGKPPTRGTLFLFDEPTTGLHFDDVAKLMRAFRKLLAAGPLAGRHRAQPRRHLGGRLADRPRTRGRRRRRRSRRGRHAGRGHRGRPLAHRSRTRRISRRARQPRATPVDEPRSAYDAGRRCSH